MTKILFWQTTDQKVTNEDQNSDIFARILQWSWNVLEISVYVTNSDQTEVFLWEPKYVKKMSKKSKYMMPKTTQLTIS